MVYICESQNLMLTKSLIRSLLRRYAVGAPIAHVCLQIGARDLSRKIGSLCRYIPPTIDVEVPHYLARGRHFSMHSGRGLDQVARPIWWQGWSGFERPLPELFGALTRHARCVLDVGSYSGFYSLVAACCSQDAQIFAFEPFPIMQHWLRANIKLNNWDDRIHIVRCAIGDHIGDAELYIPTSGTDLLESACSLNSRFAAEHLAALQVDVRTLDDFTAEMACAPVDVIKIDVESQEHFVLRGAGRILREDRPIVFLEVLQQASCQELEGIRSEAGYLCAVLHEGSVHWRDSIAPDPMWPNQVLCPEEKIEQLVECITMLGLASIGSMKDMRVPKR